MGKVTIGERDDGSLEITADHELIEFIHHGDEDGVEQARTVRLHSEVVDMLDFHYEAKEITSG